MVDYLLAWGFGAARGGDRRPIKNVVGIASRPLHVLVARPEHPIRPRNSQEQSHRRRLRRRHRSDYLSRVAVRHFGFEPEKDVKIIVTGESPTRLAALRSGSIDATPIDVAFAVKAEDEGFRPAWFTWAT